MTAEAHPTRRSWRHIVRFLLRWGLALAVLGFVASHAADLWDTGQARSLSIDSRWLLAAGLVYLTGWLPSVWFMRRLLRESGHPAASFSVARAYYCGHLGKYVPGKAAVVLIRAVLLRDRGVPAGAAALATVAETLALMGTGLALTLALATHALPESVWDRLPPSLLWLKESPGFVTLIVVLLTLISVPAVTGFAGRMAGKIARKSILGRQTAADDQTATGNQAATEKVAGNQPAASDWSLRLSAGLLLQALPAFCGAWLLHGLSLWCVLNAIGNPEVSVNSWLVCTVAAAGGTSVGFFVLIAPGGLGIREGLIFAAVTPLVGAPLAGAASILLRAVWFAAEVGISAVLYLVPTFRTGHFRRHSPR